MMVMSKSLSVKTLGQPFRPFHGDDLEVDTTSRNCAAITCPPSRA